MIQPWPLISSKPIGDFRIFTLRADRKVSPRTRREHDFFVIDSVNWVNVVAVTPDQQIVLVEQYRHGSNTVELEIPGGVMDAGDASPEATALRELDEETGYQGENARVVGQVLANPAIMNNCCYTVFAENCQLRNETRFDTGEDIVTRLVPLADIPKLIAENKIRHSVMIAGLYHFELWRRNGGGGV